MKIALQLQGSAIFSPIFFGVLLFWPAGTFDYWQAWVFIAVFIIATMAPTIYLAVKYPDAFRRRLRAGPSAETRMVQKLITVGIIRDGRSGGMWSAPLTTGLVGRPCRRRSWCLALCSSWSAWGSPKPLSSRTTMRPRPSLSRRNRKWFRRACTALSATRCTSER